MTSVQGVVRIGGASGFWGDSSVGAPQLVASGGIDYLVFDYLAETTMAILAAARLRKPAMGYATDFVDAAMRQVLKLCLAQGIKVVANAGGIHPRACAQALRALADELGLNPRIAVVEGDDVSALMPNLHVQGVRDMFSAEPVPDKVLSANAYLGALPIARALAAGADVVITGRCVDSAVTLGPLIHEFGWAAHDYDRLAGGSLAGHIIECGAQATGGLHTDWQAVPDWAHIGYPIAQCSADGSFVITKPAGSGGIIRRECIAEQLLYEIGDPGAYLLPDVACDFRQVRIEQVDDQHVRVSQALGRAPGGCFKVSATLMHGWRCTGSLVIIGIDAAAKARRTGESIIERTRELIQQAGFADYSLARVELLGAETLYGPHARSGAAREVMVRVVVNHAQKAALEIFAREISAPGTSWSPGTTGAGSGRPSPSPLIKPISFLLPKGQVEQAVWLDGQRLDEPSDTALDTAADAAASGTATGREWTPIGADPSPASAVPDPTAWHDDQGPQQTVRLIDLAWARSGDKGDISNIGIVARRPEWLPLLWHRLTPEVVQSYFAHLAKGKVERFHLPGLQAINFMLHQALDGGGPGSARIDPLGKGMAQMLLDLELQVPRGLLGAERL